MEQRSVQQRLIALGGLVAIVGVLVGLLALGGVLGNQSGGEGIENVALLDTPPANGRGDLEVGSRAGELAPNFEISDFDGERHRLSDFRGKVVYINFWATWCAPCQEELPDLAYIADQYGDDLAVISVNRQESVDRARDFLGDLPRFDGSRGVEFTVNGVDPDDTLFDEYRALRMPSSYIIDQDGVVTPIENAGIGQLSREEMQDAVDAALASADQTS
ncbi:MAG: TlpA disulfide reductase family protein [Dehalococcoidia bacterium]